MGAWEIGMYLRPLECDGMYILGPQSDYVDPLYTTIYGKFVIRIYD